MKFTGKQLRSVTLEYRTTTTNNFNEEVESWNPASLPETDANGTIYVERWDQGGKETTDGQTVAYADVRMKTRYIQDLDPVQNRNALRDYRINENGRIYDIENVKEIGRKEGLMLITEMQDNE